MHSELLQTGLCSEWNDNVSVRYHSNAVTVQLCQAKYATAEETSVCRQPLLHKQSHAVNQEKRNKPRDISTRKPYEGIWLQTQKASLSPVARGH